MLLLLLLLLFGGGRIGKAAAFVGGQQICMFPLYREVFDATIKSSSQQQRQQHEQRHTATGKKRQNRNKAIAPKAQSITTAEGY